MIVSEILSLYFQNHVSEASNAIETLLQEEYSLSVVMLKAQIDNKIGHDAEFSAFLKNYSPEMPFLSLNEIFELSLIHANHHLQQFEYEEFRYYLNKAADVYQSFESLLEMSMSISEFFRLQARWEILQGNLPSAKLMLETCLQINRSIGNITGEGSNLNSLGYIQTKYGDLEAALNYYLEASVLFNQIEEHSLAASCYNNIGGIMFEKGNILYARDFFQHALHHTTDNVKLLDLRSKILNNLGNIAFSQGRLQVATDYYHESRIIKGLLQDRNGLARIYHNLGRVVRAQGDLVNALEYFMTAADLQTDHGYLLDKIVTSNELVVTHCKLGNIDEAKKIVGTMTKLVMDHTDDNSLLILTFTKAMVMRYSDELAFKLSSRNTFLNLFENKKLTYELRVESLMQVIELDLHATDHLIPTGRLKLPDLLNRLHKLSQENSLIFYLIKVLLVKSKLVLVEGDVKHAKLLRTQAEIMAIEHDMTHIIKDLSDDQETKKYTTSNYQEILKGEMENLVSDSIL